MSTDRSAQDLGEHLVVLRRTVVISNDIRSVRGRALSRPLKKVAACAIIANPYADTYVESLEGLSEIGKALGTYLGHKIVEELGSESSIESLGKAAIVGEGGEIEHAAALLHPYFGHSVRAAVGGASTMLPSSKKIGSLGASIDVPVHFRNAAYVRSHFDAIEVRVPDAPLRDEIVICLAATDGGRPFARVGGLQLSEVKGEDGLR